MEKVISSEGSDDMHVILTLQLGPVAEACHTDNTPPPPPPPNHAVEFGFLFVSWIVSDKDA